MSRQTYRIDASDGTTYLSVDLSQAASPISVGYDDGDPMRWESSHYQTADAGHDLDTAALLALRWAYRNGDWNDEGGQPQASDIISVTECEIEENDPVFRALFDRFDRRKQPSRNPLKRNPQ